MSLRVIRGLALCGLAIGVSSANASSEKVKQRAIAEWKQLTASSSPSLPTLAPTGRKGNDDPAPPPQVFLKGDKARLYFQSGEKFRVFTATWKPDRAPTDKYRVN